MNTTISQYSNKNESTYENGIVDYYGNQLGKKGNLFYRIVLKKISVVRDKKGEVISIKQLPEKNNKLVIEDLDIDYNIFKTDDLDFENNSFFVIYNLNAEHRIFFETNRKEVLAQLGNLYFELEFYAGYSPKAQPLIYNGICRRINSRRENSMFITEIQCVNGTLLTRTSGNYTKDIYKDLQQQEDGIDVDDVLGRHAKEIISKSTLKNAYISPKAKELFKKIFSSTRGEAINFSSLSEARKFYNKKGIDFYIENNNMYFTLLKGDEYLPPIFKIKNTLKIDNSTGVLGSPRLSSELTLENISFLEIRMLFEPNLFLRADINIKFEDFDDKIKLNQKEHTKDKEEKKNIDTKEKNFDTIYNGKYKLTSFRHEGHIAGNYKKKDGEKGEIIINKMGGSGENVSTLHLTPIEMYNNQKKNNQKK